MISLAFKISLLCLVSFTTSCKNSLAESLMQASEVSLEPIAGYYKADENLSGDIRILLGADGRYRITRILFFGKNQGFSIAYMKEDKAAVILDISVGRYKAEKIMGQTFLRFFPQTDGNCAYDGFRFKDITTMALGKDHITIPAAITENLVLSRREAKAVRQKEEKITSDNFTISEKERRDYYIANNVAHFSGCIGYDYKNDSISFGVNATPIHQ